MHSLFQPQYGSYSFLVENLQYFYQIFKETLADFEKESHTIQQTASQHAEVPGQSLGMACFIFDNTKIS